MSWSVTSWSWPKDSVLKCPDMKINELHSTPSKSIVPFTELHSQEIQEIVSRPPHWLLRWGIGLCFGVILLLLGAAWWIRYPDIVTAPFLLTALDAPREVVTKTDGRLTQLLAADGQKVEGGQAVAYLESTTDHQEALQLQQWLEVLRGHVGRQDWKMVRDFDLQGFTQLGELQNAFQTFFQQYTQLRAYLQDGMIVRKRVLLLDDLRDLNDMLAVLESQTAMQQKDFEIAREEFSVHERLYDQKVIPVLEFKREQAKLLARGAPLKQLEASIIQNRSSRTAKQKELLELDNTVYEQKTTFINALLTLESTLSAWKQRFVLTAPVSGRVSYLAPWQEHQTLKTGEPVMTIEPESSGFRGLANIPQTNLGKLRQGQQVLVRLDGYPYREFGLINGRLSDLSVTPGRDSSYWATIALPDGLRTRYGHDLTYKNGMKGTVDIITADRRLIERLLSAISSGGANQ